MPRLRLDPSFSSAPAGRRRAFRGFLALLLTLGVSSVAGQEAVERGADITIHEGSDRTVYEYRHNGILRIIKIVPSFGRPYYLVPADPTEGVDLERVTMLIPRWTLVEF